MSLRSRTASTKLPGLVPDHAPTSSTASSSSDGHDDGPDTPKSSPPPSLLPPAPPAVPSLSQRALTTTANLANLLPTGTLLAFQLLMPVFTHNGACDYATRYLTLILLLLLAASCFLASLTDSFRAPDGVVYYGIATRKGMYLFDYPADAPGLPELSKYRLRFMDVVHAVLSVFVFGAVALRDKNVLSCFYPTPKHETQEVLDIVPVGIGLLCSLMFVVFPTRRHGIGYPVTPGR